MTQPLYLPDTHTLYWYITQSTRLSPTARDAFSRAKSGEAVIIASPVVLAELYWILRKQGAGPAFAGLCRGNQASIADRAPQDLTALFSPSMTSESDLANEA